MQPKGLTHRRVTLFEIFGSDPYNSSERNFSIQQARGTHPNMYYKIEWAKQVLSIYRRMLKNGEVDGKVHAGFVSPYPSPPKERHESKNQKEARARGAAAGLATKRARIKKKRVRKVETKRKSGPKPGRRRHAPHS